MRTDDTNQLTITRKLSMSHDISFLETLLNTPGPSGFEQRPAKVWRAEAEGFADVWTDVVGNSYAGVGLESRPRVLMAGHIDEIGLQVTHADDSGLLYFGGIGGWDPQVVVGQRVLLLSQKGDIPGVIGRKAIHLLEPKEREKAVKLKDLWIDVGASSKEELDEMGVRVGDPAVLNESMIRLAGDRIASRAIDNRMGAWVVLEALRILSKDRKEAGAIAVATTQEEIGYQGGGARTSAYETKPDVALVVDVTHATDVPDVEKKEVGDHKLGGGPVLSRGSVTHPDVFERLASVAEANDIPYSIQAAPRFTSTDADNIHLVRTGIPTGLVSVPNRYMHSPSEVVSIDDLVNTARLLAAFVQSLDGDVSFVRS